MHQKTSLPLHSIFFKPEVVDKSLKQLYLMQRNIKHKACVQGFRLSKLNMLT